MIEIAKVQFDNSNHCLSFPFIRLRHHLGMSAPSTIENSDGSAQLLTPDSAEGDFPVLPKNMKKMKIIFRGGFRPNGAGLCKAWGVATKPSQVNGELAPNPDDAGKRVGILVCRFS